MPSKLCIDNRIPDRVNKFACLGYILSYQEQADMSNKITKYSKSVGVINIVLIPSLVQRHT